MEISHALKEQLKIRPLTFRSQTENLNFQVFCWDIFDAESFLFTKLLKSLRFRKDLKNIQPLISEIEALTSNKPKEVPPKNANSIQIVLRVKSSSFKGFYILLPNSLDHVLVLYLNAFLYSCIH